MRLDERNLISKALAQHPVLAEYENKIYDPGNIYLIPSQDRDKADLAADKLFAGYVSKYKRFGVTPHNAVRYMATGEPGLASNKTYIYDLENEWNTWRVQAVVEGKNGKYNEKNGKYLPPSIAAYHELMHIEEIKAGQKAKTGHVAGDELLPTTKTIILTDEIYKKINNMPIDAVVDYGHSINIRGKDISIGQLANFYRNLENKYGNLAKAITSAESLEFLSEDRRPDILKDKTSHNGAVNYKTVSSQAMDICEASYLKPLPTPEAQLQSAKKLGIACH